MPQLSNTCKGFISIQSVIREQVVMQACLPTEAPLCVNSLLFHFLTGIQCHRSACCSSLSHMANFLIQACVFWNGSLLRFTEQIALKWPNCDMFDLKWWDHHWAVKSMLLSSKFFKDFLNIQSVNKPKITAVNPPGRDFCSLSWHEGCVYTFCLITHFILWYWLMTQDV